MLSRSSLRSRLGRYVPQAAALAVFGITGVLLLNMSHAATPTASLEAETGTKHCVRLLADSAAAAGSAIQFGSTGCTADAASLDASGATIPDTAYPVPAGAVFMAATGNDANTGTAASPVRTLNAAIGLVPAGGTIVARAGTYRDWYNNGSAVRIATKSFTLQAYPHEQVWFDGSDIIAANAWTSDGNGHWYKSWSTPSFCNGQYYDFPYNNQSKSPSNLTGASGATYSDNTGPCTHWDQYGSSSANYPAAGDPQMLFVDGSQKAEVDSLSAATGGSFFYDWANKRLYISTDPSGHTVELSARPAALVLGTASSAYSIKGIGFRHYASNEYSNITSGAVYVGGNNPAAMENDVFTQNAGVGLEMTTAQSTVDSSIFAFNGSNGAGYYGHAHTTHATDNYQLTNSVFNQNNSEKYGLNCSLSCAAAGIKMAAVSGYTIKGNIFENNQGKSTGAWCDTDCSAGVFTGNVATGNYAGYHYEQNDDGIIAGNLFTNNTYGVDVGSSNVRLYNNTFVNNQTINVRLYDDDRPLLTSHLSLGNNVVYGTSINDDYFAGGSDPSTQTEPSSWFDYLDYNSYWRPASFVLYRLIGASDTHYNSVAALRAVYPSWEAHAQDVVGGGDPFFADVAAGDYRVRADSQAYRSGGPIPADVAAALGVPTAAGQTRGAFDWPGKP